VAINGSRMSRHVTLSPPRGEVPYNPSGLPIIIVIVILTGIIIVCLHIVGVKKVMAGVVVKVGVGRRHYAPLYVAAPYIEVSSSLAVTAVVITSTGLADLI
jgi:hypothetical protein